jgi:hypothetical protein
MAIWPSTACFTGCQCPGSDSTACESGFIYVYEPPATRAGGPSYEDAPAHLAKWDTARGRYERMLATGGFADSIYLAELEFTRRLLDDWRVRTLNPKRASLFYVPAFSTFVPMGNLGCADYFMDPLVRGLQLGKDRVLFASTNFSRHVVFLAGDKGACGYRSRHMLRRDDGIATLSHETTSWMESEIGRPIFLTHWGLRVPWRWRNPNKVGRFAAGETSAGALEAPCSVAHDVVLPMSFRFSPLADGGGARGTSGAALHRHRGGFECTLFFAGSIRKFRVLDYAQGVRKRIHALHSKAPGFCLYDGRAPVSLFDRSRFCLVVSGDGFGSRLSHAFEHLCVPLIVQPNVAQPFSELLPFENFSVSVRHDDLHRLPAILEAVNDARHEAMQRSMRYWRSAFDWFAPNDRIGAYAFTIYSLCLRAQETTAGHACSKFRPRELSD